MPNQTLLKPLCESIYPALLETYHGAADAALPALLRGVIARMAAARGLIAPPEPDMPGPARTTLDALDFSDASPHLPGMLYNTLQGDRRERGAYYTPPALALDAARRALLPLLGDPARLPRVLDPALGAGVFLIAAGELMAGWLADHGDGAPPEARRWRACAGLYGIDRDPLAVEVARASLWLWAAPPDQPLDALPAHLICADALLDDGAVAKLNPPFDAVLGNPPFASVFTRAASDEQEREQLSAHYQTARGAFDLSVPFVERALTLVRRGGRCALVLPNKLLAASYAAALRRWLRSEAALEALIDHAGGGHFDADVYPVLVVLQRNPHPPDAPLQALEGRAAGAPVLIRQGTQRDLDDLPGHAWSPLLDPDWDLLRRCFEGTRPLGDLAELAAGLTVGEAYDLRDRVIEAPGLLPLNSCRLLTSGLLERYVTRWGQVRAPFLKRSFRRPVIPSAALPERRQAQAAGPKLVIAGMGLRPRVYHDAGLSQASVSTVIITEAAWPLGALCALLNAGLLARLYRALYGGLALSGGYLRFGKRELASMPLPDLPAGDPRIAALDRLAAQRAASVRDAPLDARIDALVCSLYGIDLDTLNPGD